MSGVPAGYPAFLKDLKERIRATQVKAAISVNRELIELYWHIGKSVVKKQKSEGWGKSVVSRLASDLMNEFPGTSGFSPQNLWKMRAFYLAWTDEVPNLSQPVRELDGANLPQAVADLPWGHNTELIFKVKDPFQRIWYAHQTVIHGWSRSVLVHHIESGLFRRQGKAVTNFHATLPPPQSDLAEQVLKDPYNFDFLTLTPEAHEREMERGLLAHLRKFLLELGTGFAFVGEQHHLEVGGEDFYIDLVFYHLRLRCFVVIDLKTEPFKPEFAGKMNFYLSAVDDILRHAEDRPSIGLILCRDRNKLVAEYALRDLRKPIGVAGYRLMERLPADLEGSLPTVEEIEAELWTSERTGR
ncbi:MAG TPA: PDDEXK nuclease domain-containing protein [Thermoplasmata archaeon]|nr:PDDEXK nuclease domain-containing protein [Thermoplasmata archaeon]